MAKKEENPNLKKYINDKHSPEKFKEHFEYWKQYHAKVVDPVTGKETTRHELLKSELSDLIKEKRDELEKNIGKENARDPYKFEEEFFKLAKETYLADMGLKEGDISDDVLDKKAKEYAVQIASSATNSRFNTYEEVIADIMSAENPIYGTSQEERSKVLDAMLNQYGVNKHEGKHELVKGLSAKKLGEVETKLDSKYFKPLLMEKGHELMKEYFPNAKFNELATNSFIRSKIVDLMNNEKKANIKHKAIDVDGDTYVSKDYKDPKKIIEMYSKKDEAA